MPYRVEEASTGRAGCKNKECQDKKEKILKGELRLGSWIETEQFQSWAWKHWGCVTPKQIAGLQDTVGEDKDYDLLDGYDEISSENQKKVRDAIEQGHVADSDWRGDVEMNRPGKVGFRVRKKKDDSKAKDENKATKKGTKKGGKKEAEKDEDEKPSRRSKKTKEAEPKKRKSSATEGKGDHGEEPATKRQKPGRKPGKTTKETTTAKETKAKDSESPKANRARRAADRAARKASA